METDRVRQIAAAIVGILVIVVLVLLARWTGDKIRERFLTPKPAVVSQPAPIVQIPKEENKVLTSATYSAIPSTGPNDWAYVALGTMAILGFGFLKFASRYYI